MRGFAERVGLRFAAQSRRSIPLIAVEGLGRRPRFRGVGTAVGWAVLLVSTPVEVCVARERARGPESRRSHKLACRSLCPAARHHQRSVSTRCGRILAVMCFLLFAPREGARFASGLASCGGELPCLVLAVFLTRKQSFDPGCTGQIDKFTGQLRNDGFFLLCIQMTLIFSNPPSQRSRALMGSMV